MFRLLAFGGALLLGCSAGEDERERTRDEFCGEWAQAACGTQTVSACQAPSAETCRTAQKAFCLQLVPQNFSDARGDACLRAVERAYQDADLTAVELLTVLRLGPPCDAIIQGPLQLGEACTHTRDCNAARGFVCVLKGTNLGTCQIPETVQGGFACNLPQQVCTSGFYCNGDNCIAHKNANSACTSDDECAAFCSQDEVCAERLARGSPCVRDQECESNLCYEYALDDRTCTDQIRLSRSEPICASLR